MKSLGPDGMSGDESEHRRGQKRYVVYQDQWRNPAIIEWIRKFDLIFIQTKFNAIGRAARGNWPRKREPTSQHVTRQGRPVVGLPANFYNDLWLKTLNEEDLADLQIKPAIALLHTQQFLR